MAALQRGHPDAVIEVWAEDEHRVGLLPIGRRVWAPQGRRPLTAVHRRYQWEYVYGFIHPATGQSSFTVLPTVSARAMSVALTLFAQDAGIDATHRAALVLDRAGWHTAATLAIPDGIDLLPLPPASPELQPAERVWPLVNEALANRAFTTLAALEAELVHRCRTLIADPTVLRRYTHFGWWPADALPPLL